MIKTSLLSVGCATVLLASSAITASAAVVPGDTFGIELYGGTNDDHTFPVLPLQNVVFGTINTYPGMGINGQDITISSSEVIGATTTTDTILISTPVSFYTLDTYNGSTVSGFFFELGNQYAGDNPLQLQPLVPFSILDLTGSVTYSGGTLPLFPEFGLGQDVRSFNADEAIVSSNDADAPPIDQFNVNSMSFVLNYPNAPAPVPEPSTLALAGLGLLGGAAAMVRRRRLAA